ncbi:MAG: FMN-dependent NADH-azoreductase [Streptococcaceae bacterium]|jgi:FMN-dependent NADH-azoreductase|nr:FMN-dependent NADH-azoreductase [Streptococcaceae bacterium]MCH4177874.1 FMN-dependent NADH-azoreductase [Streptococcaceae bacterium]
MSKVLVIKSHPLDAETSRSILILDTFINEYQTLNPGDTIEVVDLYNSFIPEIDKDVLTAWGALAGGQSLTELSDDQAQKVTRLNELIDQFIEADKVVVANPLWNLNVPTRLKAWFDAINVAGKTFKYTENGPVPLTPGKKTLHIQSNGGFYEGKDASSLYVKGIFEFLGADEVNQIFIEGIDYQPERKAEILEAAQASAKEIAANF